MEDLGADIAKIAVMPQSAGDVLTLLSATHKASQSLSCPLITMSIEGTAHKPSVRGGVRLLPDLWLCKGSLCTGPD